MNPERLARIEEMERAARAAVAALGLEDLVTNHESRTRAAASVEAELARRFPGEDPELLRRLADDQVGRRRRRRKKRLAERVLRGPLIPIAFGLAALLGALLFYTRC